MLFLFLLGFFLEKIGFVGGGFVRDLEKTVLYTALPCLLFEAFASIVFRVSPGYLFATVFASFAGLSPLRGTVSLIGGLTTPLICLAIGHEFSVDGRALRLAAITPGLYRRPNPRGAGAVCGTP